MGLARPDEHYPPRERDQRRAVPDHADSGTRGDIRVTALGEFATDTGCEIRGQTTFWDYVPAAGFDGVNPFVQQFTLNQGFAETVKSSALGTRIGDRLGR